MLLKRTEEKARMRPPERRRDPTRFKISFDREKLVSPPANLCIVGFVDIEIPKRNELSQSGEGLVCECGQIVVDGKLIKDDGLFAIERTAAVSRLIEAGMLLDQGVGIQSGWISTSDGRIVKA